MGTHEYLWVSKYPQITYIEIHARVWIRIPYLNNETGTDIILPVHIDISKLNLYLEISVLFSFVPNIELLYYLFLSFLFQIQIKIFLLLLLFDRSFIEFQEQHSYIFFVIPNSYREIQG